MKLKFENSRPPAVTGCLNWGTPGAHGGCASISSSRRGPLSHLKNEHCTGAEEASPERPRNRDHGHSTKFLNITTKKKKPTHKILFSHQLSASFCFLCYWLNASVPPKSIYWCPNSQCDGIWRWTLWKVMRVGLYDGISGLIRKETETKPLSPSIKWGHIEKPSTSRGKSSPKRISLHLDLELPGSRNVRNKCLLFKPPVCILSRILS